MRGAACQRAFRRTLDSSRRDDVAASLLCVSWATEHPTPGWAGGGGSRIPRRLPAPPLQNYVVATHARPCPVTDAQPENAEPEEREDSKTAEPEESETGDTSPRERRFEIVATVLLAVTALATAWSGYQASLWDGIQSSNYTQASAARTEASQNHTEANQLRLGDLSVFEN